MGAAGGIGIEFGVVALGGSGWWEERGWCLHRELCSVQRDLACRAGEASSMIDKVLGGTITVNHNLLSHSIVCMYDF